jgi:hypothetical protein
MAVAFTEDRKEEAASPSMPVGEAQQELFRLFAQLFGALTGRAVELIAAEREIKDLMLWRLKHEPDAMADVTNAATDELAAFYSANAVKLFQHAKTLGGMRLVTGGQRAFGPSALNAVSHYRPLRGHGSLYLIRSIRISRLTFT